MEERIKAIYNDCWTLYKQYLIDHDMAKYNIRMINLRDKYGAESDILDLLFWWVCRIQGLHDQYKKKLENKK